MDKVAAVLDTLAEQGELSVVELARATSEPRSSMYRLLGSLERLGWVEPGSRRGSVRLGLRLFQLGSQVAQRFDVRQRAIAPMEELHRATEETILLMVRRGTDAVCIERLDGRYVSLVIVQVGSSMPLHTGAAPRAILAFSPPEVVDEALDGELLAYTRHTVTDAALVRRGLEQIRRHWLRRVRRGRGAGRDGLRRADPRPSRRGRRGRQRGGPAADHPGGARGRHRRADRRDGRRHLARPRLRGLTSERRTTCRSRP